MWMARALGISLLMQVTEARKRISDGDLVIVDALSGRAFFNPEPEMLRKYKQLESHLKERIQ